MTTQQKKKKLRNKCDKLYQEIGRMMYNKCLICNGDYSCLHHYIPKSRSSNLRYNLKNGINICKGCHNGIHRANDPRIISKIIRIKGDKWLEEIEKESRKRIKTNLTYYREVEEQLKVIINNIK